MVVDTDASTTAGPLDTREAEDAEPAEPDTRNDEPDDGEAADGDGADDSDLAASGDADADPPDGASCTPGAVCALALAPPPCREGRCDADGTCVGTPIPGCCTTDWECALEPLSSPCSEWRCVAGRCAATPSPGCCTADPDCDDGERTTEDHCGDGTGLCTHCSEGGACADLPPLFAADFDGSAFITAGGFSAQDTSPQDGVAWRVSTRRAVSPPGAAYLGRADCPTYYGGALDGACAALDPDGQDSRRVSVTLRTPLLALPLAGPPMLATVWVFADVEPFRGGPAEPDVLRVFVEVDGTGVATEVASTLTLGKSTAGLWRQLAIDLAPWRGQAVRLRFAFDSLDGQLNGGEGLYLDDLRVAAACADGGCCGSDGDCAATGDACAVARCTLTSNGAGRVCVGGPRTPGTPCTPCEATADCDDRDPCTIDRCDDDGSCAHDAFCCFRETFLGAGFEGALAPFTAVTAVGGAAWQLSPGRAFEGDSAAWFGAPGRDDYDTGGPVAGALWSGEIALPAPTSADPGLDVVFAVWLDTEWTGVDYDNPGGVDRLWLDLVTADGVATELWSSDSLGGTTAGDWVVAVADLGPFAGRVGRLRFTFDSVDAERNDHGGAYLDATEIRTHCPD